MKHLLILILFLSIPGTSLLADDMITNFHSEVLVKVDRSLEIRETITINVEGTKIRQDFYRDIPMDRIMSQGIRTRVKLLVVNVSVDGNKEPFEITDRGAYKRIRIARPDETLTHGLHSIVIDYVLTNQVSFYNHFDEVYWNVTGKTGEFTIQQASVKFILPSGAEIMGSAATSEYPGDSICNCTGGPLERSIWEGQTMEPLYPGMAYRVTISFTKGFIPPPTKKEIQSLVFLRKRIFYAGYYGVLATVISCFLVLLFTGKNNDRGVIFPRFTSPANIPPDLARAIFISGYDKKVFTAAILQLAIKGAISISKKGNTYTLHKSRLQPADLKYHEKKILGKLFKRENFLKIEEENGKEISEAITFHESGIINKLADIQFRFQKYHALPGILLSLTTLMIMNVWIMRFSRETFHISLFTGSICLFSIPFILFILKKFHPAVKPIKVFYLIMMVISVCFLANLVTGGIQVITGNPDLDGPVLFFYSGIFCFLIFLGFLFSYLISIPTGKGRKLDLHLRGLKKYLSGPEIDPILSHKPPAMTVRQFEKLAPFAEALDAGHNWSPKFEHILRVTSESGYPVVPWYACRRGNFRSLHFNSDIRKLDLSMARFRHSPF